MTRVRKKDKENVENNDSEGGKVKSEFTKDPMLPSTLSRANKQSAKSLLHHSNLLPPLLVIKELKLAFIFKNCSEDICKG